MSQRKIEMETATLVWGQDFTAVAHPEMPSVASKMICKKCGKKYSPGSTKAMVRHIGDHFADGIA